MLLLLLSLSLSITLAQAALINYTIDDEWGDSITGVLPIYAPNTLWKLGSTCLSCHVSSFVDYTRPFDTTWHDSTSFASGEDINITVTFTGTAVYVYNILANNISSALTTTTLKFYIDGENVGMFTHSPDTSATILYDVPVYVNDTLPDTAHTLFISTAGEASLVLFDYIMYTFNDSTGPLSPTLRSTPSEVPSVTHTPPINSTSSTTSESSATPLASSATSAFSTNSPSSATPPVTSSMRSTSHILPDATPFLGTRSITRHPLATSISPSNISSTSPSHSASLSSSPHGTPRVPLSTIVAGATGGGMAASLFVSIGICYLRRRRARRRRPNCIVDLGKPADPTTSGDEFLIEPERGSQSVLDIGFSSPLQEAQYRARSPSAQRSWISSGVLAVVGTRESGFSGFFGGSARC